VSSKRILLKIFLYGVAVYAVFGFTVLLFQKQLTYHPRPLAAGRQTALSSYNWLREVRFESSDGTKLHGVWAAPPEDGVVVILSHGNSGNLSGRIPLVEKLRDLGLGVFLYDYRGFGASEGEPDEQGLYRDSEAAWEWVRSKGGIEPEKVVSYGRSLGAAVALHLALTRDVAGVVLEAPFTSIRDMAGEVIPFFPAGPFLRESYDNLEAVRALTHPVLIIVGEEDTVVPPWMGKTLFEAASEPKRLLLIPGGGHTDAPWVAAEAYTRTVSEFVQSLGAGGLLYEK